MCVPQLTLQNRSKASQDHNHNQRDHDCTSHDQQEVSSSSLCCKKQRQNITMTKTTKEKKKVILIKKDFPSRNFKPKTSRERSTSQKQKKERQKTNIDALDLTLEDQAQFVAMDCEFVGIGPGGLTSALARVSIVDYNYNILLDTYVKVNDPVTDYRTFVSGITEDHTESDLAMDRVKCVDAVEKILHGKILIGHGLKNDLAVLGIHHPWHDTRDTAKYEPFMKKQSKDANYPSALPRPRKLKDLAWTKLNRVIQNDGVPHCSIEDAIAALDLYKKARLKWEKAMQYKVQRTIEICQQM